MINEIDVIWQHSRYYGDMVATSLRLHNEGENYAALMILFNAMELILKSVRENYQENLVNDINDLKNKGLLSEEDCLFPNNKENGIREIRNILTHRDAYQYVFEDLDGNAMLFSDNNTWNVIYTTYSSRIIDILVGVLS